MTSGTTGAYLLMPEHAGPLAQLVREAADDDDPRLLTLARSGGIEAWVASSNGEREAGRAYGLTIVDRGQLVGFSLLHALTDSAGPAVDCWIAPPFRRRGFGAFGLGKALELAFQNLQLSLVRVHARDGSAAWRHTLERAGFRAAADGDSFELTRDRWTEMRAAPALARLHPLLSELLGAELAAGNEVLETGGGWPDDDSVFVRVKYPFRARPAILPDGVDYQEPNDPHWWKADYSTRSPRHILAC